MMALGIVGYFGSGTASHTALIPAAFGVVLLVLGVIAQNDRARRHAMHLAAMIGVIGFAGTARALLKLPSLLGGAAVERPAAVAAQSAMAVLMAIFVALCVRSFVAARRARRQA